MLLPLKKIVGRETEDISSSAEAENIVFITGKRMCDHEIKNSSGNSVTPEDVACQIKAVTDPLSCSSDELRRAIGKTSRKNHFF